MGTKNQDIIVTKKRITAQIHFWIMPIPVTNQWRSVIQGCIQSCKAKAFLSKKPSIHQKFNHSQ